jgi:hypothetical protein
LDARGLEHLAAATDHDALLRSRSTRMVTASRAGRRAEGVVGSSSISSTVTVMECGQLVARHCEQLLAHELGGDERLGLVR